MVRVVGDRLIVNVGRKPGEEQMVDLVKLFNENPKSIIAAAATVGADGAPNTGPVSLIYPRDEKTQRVVQGPASGPRSEKAQAFEKADFAELIAATTD
jgi:hypothetical protein